MSRQAFALRCLIAGAGLGIAWLGFHRWQVPDFVLTRYGDALPVAPLYAFFQPTIHWTVVLAVGTLAAGAWLLPRVQGRSLFVFGVLLFCVLFRFSVHSVRAPELPGDEFAVYAGEEVVDDLSRIQTPARFLREYTSIQPTLSLHGRTKPPGFALFYYGLTKVLGTRSEVRATAIALLGCLLVVPAYFLGLLVLDHEDLARRAAVLTAVIPSGVLYGAVSFDALLAPVLLTAITVAAWEIRSPRAWRRWLLGSVLGVGLMLSYSTLTAGLLIGTLLLAGWRSEPIRIPRRAFEVAAATLAIPVLLFLTTGFDGWECLVNARALNMTLLLAASGSHLTGLFAWLYGSVGNILAFTLSVGLPAFVGLLALRWSNLASGERALLAGLILTLLVACFGRIYWMETERILLFLTPVVAILAIRRIPATPAWIVAGGQAVLAEALLYTLW